MVTKICTFLAISTHRKRLIHFFFKQNKLEVENTPNLFHKLTKQNKNTT